MKKVVILSGAGMSAESGFSTFRDAGGLWEQVPVEDVATPEGYAKNPQLVTDFYNRLRRQLVTAKPCEGHRLVAKLEKFFDVTVITQNVDNLHECAGSSRVVHLHGELMKVTSSKHPNDPRCIRKLGLKELEVKTTDLAADGSPLRPFIVWFGEGVPLMDSAVEYASKADIFIIIGTSLNVYPAAGLVHYVPREAQIFLIDPKDVAIDQQRVTHLKKGASEGMRALMKLLKCEQ